MPDDTDKSAAEDDVAEPEEPLEAATPPRKRRPASRPKARPAAEVEDADEDDLTVAAAPPASRGSGATWVIAVVIIVVMLAVITWAKLSSDEKARQRAVRDSEMKGLASRLSTVRDRVDKALRELDQADPAVDRAIEALNGAAENMGVLGGDAAKLDPDLGGKLVAMQGSIRQAAQGLEQDRLQYEEQVKAARRELNLSATRRVRPLAANLDSLSAVIGQSPGTPIVPTMAPPNVPATPAAEPAEGPPPAAEPGAGAASPAPEGGGAAPTTPASPGGAG